MSDTKEGDQYGIPSAQIQQEAGELHVLDESGKKIAFKSLYTDAPNGAQRHLIVFIRHFYCGQCEGYVRALTRDLPPSTLASTNTHLTIIGCGEPHIIPDYQKHTCCPFPIYCDPERALYVKLGMQSSLALGDKKPEYASSSLIAQTASSMYNILSNGRRGFQGGDFSQNGGEWLYEGGKVAWCRKMKNTRDHTEVKELKTVLGMSD